MTGITEPDGLTAVLLQLGELTRQVAGLDSRQAGDTRQLNGRIAALAAAVEDLKASVAVHAEAIAALGALRDRVVGLAATAGAPAGDGGGPDGQSGYQPTQPPRFWKLRGPARDAAVGKLRAWVDQVYRPGYGHLAAGLGDCWEQHPLCLYLLDWLSELWTVLYLAPARTPGTLASQAEWHTRLLPAAAGQLARETRSCAHRTARYHAADRTGARP